MPQKNNNIPGYEKYIIARNKEETLKEDCSNITQEEMKRFVDFFALLLEMDNREKRKAKMTEQQKKEEAEIKALNDKVLVENEKKIREEKATKRWEYIIDYTKKQP
jgi:hypothetical protein